MRVGIRVGAEKRLAVLLIMHSSGKGTAGVVSTDWYAAAKFVWDLDGLETDTSIAGHKTHIRMTYAKSRYADWLPEPVRLEWPSGEGCYGSDERSRDWS